MRERLGFVPVIFFVSGTALTIAGLAIMVARGASAPLAAGVILAVGLLDGLTGLVWAAGALLTSRPVEESARRLTLAAGLLAVIFLGTVLACLLYLHVIVGCLRSWRIL